MTFIHLCYSVRGTRYNRPTRTDVPIGTSKPESPFTKSTPATNYIACLVDNGFASVQIALENIARKSSIPQRCPLYCEACHKVVFRMVYRFPAFSFYHYSIFCLRQIQLKFRLQLAKGIDKYGHFARIMRVGHMDEFKAFVALIFRNERLVGVVDFFDFPGLSV